MQLVTKPRKAIQLLTKQLAEFFLVLFVVLSEFRRNGEQLEIFRLHLDVDRGPEKFCRLTVRLAKGLDLLNSEIDPFASRACHSLWKTSKITVLSGIV